MKTIYSKLASLVLLAVCMYAFSSCKDDTTSGTPEPGIPTQLALQRVNSFYEVEAPVNGDWVVTEYPDWAGPMEESGKAGEKITLFVETNDENEDRSGTLTILGTDGNTQQILLLQRGLFNDEDNGEILSSKDLNLTRGVGYTVNVFGTSPTSKYALIGNSPINHSKLVKQLNAIGEADAMVDEDRFYSQVESVTGNSTSAVANQLSVNAGVEVGIGAFKLSVEAGYAKDQSGNDRYTYAIEEIQHITGSRQLRAGALRYLADQGADIFQSSFKKQYEALKANPTDETVMRQILKKYGTHVITQGTLGGELKLSMQMKVTDQTSSSDIHAAIGLGVSVLNAEAGAELSNKEQAIADNTTISLVTYGGNNVYTIAPGTTFEAFQKTVMDKDKLEKWVSSIQSGESLSLIDMEIIPIYDLLPAEAREPMREFMIGKYQTEVYGNDTTYHGPDLYVLKNFYYDVNFDTETQVYIPELDMEVVAQRAIIPELSETEYSTVIYSGNQGDVDTTRGFFVGSPTRKPCKFTRERNGQFTIEEFDMLGERVITELYVDITGDITIYPKSNSSFYQTIEFPVGISLSDITSSPYIINKSCILHGVNDQLDVELADGITVVLDGATLRHIACQGHANIILADNSENTVDNRDDESNCSAITPGPSGTTLTISGNGSFEVRGEGAGIGPDPNSSCGSIIITGGNINVEGFNGAGIGGSELYGNCGNITITGGNINVEGFNGAGIGGSNTYGDCGNITIVGGNITARTSFFAAAIGCGYTSCGDILISDGVTKVTVIKNRITEAVTAIGRGQIALNSCGSVTIVDPSKVEEKTEVPAEPAG